MELIIEHDLATVQSEFHRPHIFTLDLIGRLAILNAAARRLRALGLRVLDEDASPNDRGAPVIVAYLNGVSPDDLRNQCDASTLHLCAGEPHRITGTFHDVRIAALIAEPVQA